MIFLWWALPSPTVPANQREAHIQTTLASGRPLITVNNWTKKFNTQSQGQLSPDQAYIVRWQLKRTPREQGVLLQLGPEGDANLTDIVAKANLFNLGHTSRNSSEWIPYFDHMRTFKDIWAGDVEFSKICLPWFHRADKHFITHEMHAYSGSMTLRFVVPQPGVLELWLEAVVISYMDAEEYANLQIIGDASQSQSQQEYYRKSWEHAKEYQRESGILATFQSSEMKQVRDVVVVGVSGDLLSRTYPIRRALLVPLAPVWSIGFLILSELFILIPGLLLILSQLGLACAGIMLSCWLRDGRPEFSEWSRKFWMTRWIPRGVGSDAKNLWGPSGPVSAEGAKDGKWDEENAMLQRPQTVRLGRHWKR